MRKLPALIVASTVLAAVALSPASAVPAPSAEAGTAVAAPPTYDATPLKSYPAFDANQAVAVDAKYFYAVNNRTITKHDRRTGEPLLQFAGDADGPFKHMDSGVVVGTKLYAVHSNYPAWPMESSIEVFDTKTMRHVDSYSFGIYRGSLTWLDRHDGACRLRARNCGGSPPSSFATSKVRASPGIAPTRGIRPSGRSAARTARCTPSACP
jgi:hypothetical protein